MWLDLQLSDWDTALEALQMLLLVSPNGNLNYFRQGVDDGNANSVQSSRDLVAAGGKLIK